jgi:hypothetical protein
MRSRILVRHFVLRFLEHDLVSSNADRREVLSVAGGTMISISLFLAMLAMLQYQFSNFLPPGLTSLRALDDRFLFVSASMLVMALLAVGLWDGLALDARDTAVLGVLPIPRAAITRAKFIAVALMAAGCDVAWNLAPTLLRTWSLPLTLRPGFRGVMVLVASHAVVTFSAGAFGFLSVFALREGLTALLGRHRFHAISSALQGALLVAVTSALLLVPGSSTRVASTWLAPDTIAAKVLPPFWFVGLHETMAGSVVDNLPRTRPGRLYLGDEREATRLYRSLWPLYRKLGRLALMALAIVGLVTIAAAAWNSRRLPVPVVRRPRATPALARAWKWAVARFVATSSIQQAGFWFTLQTLPRRVTHRAVLATATAVGLSLMIVTVRDRVLTIHTDIASVPLAILAAQSLVLASVLTGFRHAVQLPAELGSSTTFSLTWNGHLRPYLSGVKRAGWIAIALPVLAALFVWHSAVLGIRVALLHLGTGVVISMLMIEVLFARYRRVPLVSGYVPSSDLKSRGPAYVGVVLLVSYALAWVERTALAATPAYVLVLVGGVIGLSAGVAAFDRARIFSPHVLDLDEDVPSPTQRLNLAG